VALKEDRSFWALLGGSVVAAFLASTCCLGPLLFLLFGIGAGSLSFLKPFAPYHLYFELTAMGILLYLWVRYFLIVRKKARCSGGVCRYYLHYLSAGTLFAAMLLSYPYWVVYMIGE